MLLRSDCHFLRGAALTILLAASAAAQTTLVIEQLDTGQQLRAQGRYDEARRLFANLLRDVNSSRGGDRLAAIVLDNAGINETYAGNYPAAEIDFNQSLALLHASKTNDAVMASLKTHLSELYIAEQRPQDAEPLLRQAAASMRGDGHSGGVALSEIYDNLAVVCVMQRKRQEAETLLRNSTALLEKEVGPGDPRFAEPLLTYAGLLVVERRYTDSLVPAERAWQILRNSEDIADSYLAGAASILASVYYHVGRNADAETYARKAVELGEAAYGRNHPQVASYLANYAAILKRRDRKEAKEVQERADAIRARINTSDSPAGYTVVADSLIR